MPCKFLCLLFFSLVHESSTTVSGLCSTCGACNDTPQMCTTNSKTLTVGDSFQICSDAPVDGDKLVKGDLQVVMTKPGLSSSSCGSFSLNWIFQGSSRTKDFSKGNADSTTCYVVKNFGFEVNAVFDGSAGKQVCAVLKCLGSTGLLTSPSPCTLFYDATWSRVSPEDVQKIQTIVYGLGAGLGVGGCCCCCCCCGGLYYCFILRRRKVEAVSGSFAQPVYGQPQSEIVQGCVS